MNDAEARPDPDALLRRMQAEDARSRRGALRIFFGFAPGVGKTFRMLQVARDLASKQQMDVVIGVVEDHQRRETAQMAEGLEVLPRRAIEYRGRTLLEFDLEGALARRPQLILMDELAHTNAPGCRHAKRWQDVEELLDAGIDVASTLNVQHVESLNDVIAQITRVQVRETVPDSVLDRADTIELVDISPEELLERLRAGKVYLPEQAQRATEHFFRRGNLLALRELALRRTAQHVDDAVLEYRDHHGVASTWPAGERILVCVGPAPSSARLVRAAARMAAGLRCPWVAAYVEVTGLGPNGAADQTRLELHLRLAESLGGSVTRLSAGSVSAALLHYARKQNVTRIIIGKPTHSRLRDRLRGSLLDEVVRGSGDIDVHVICGDIQTDQSQGQGASKPAAPLAHYGAAVVLVTLALGVSAALRAAIDLPDPEMLFLLSIMLTAARFGRGPSALAAALSVACYDLFFVPPFYTFSVEDRRYLLTFAVLFGVGFVMSELAGRLRRQEREALAREQRTAGLYALSRELAAADQPAAIALIAARQAESAFAANVVVFGLGADGLIKQLGAWPTQTKLDPKDMGVVQWCFERGELAGRGTDTLFAAQTLCAPLRVGQVSLGVLALLPRDESVVGSEQRQFLEVFCRQVAAALERSRLADEARQAALRAQTEEMRSSLLSAVSHDLRTPLASITGAATSLRDDVALSEATRADLVDGIVDQAERLERLVGNLLDMTRLESGALALKWDWVPLDEIIGSALTRLEARLESRPVHVDLAPDIPLLRVDPVLLEQVFVNLLENAEKYTPAGSAIDIRAHSESGRVTIEVQDHGNGVPPGNEHRVFQKFFRGTHGGISGAGLGLAICRGIVEAHGGSIRVEQGTPRGARFVLVLPVGDPPPPLLELAS